MSQFDSSTFTAADGTELSASDANWTKLDAAADNAIITGNRLRRVIPSGTATARYRRTTAAPSSDYSVACDLYIVDTTSTTYNGGPMARCVAGELTGYWARWRNGTGIQLFRYNAGTATQLGSTVTQSQSAGSTLRLTLRCEGSVISVYRNAESTPIISVTDGSPITSAGYPGILTATDSTTDGPHLDNWSADTLATEATITVTTALPAFSGGASTGSASATVTATTSLPSFSGSATGDTSSGVLTLPVMKNNTGTVLANETGATVHVYAVSTGNKVVTKTGQTTNASGVMTVTDALIVSGTQYRVVVVLGSGAEGLDKVTAS